VSRCPLIPVFVLFLASATFGSCGSGKNDADHTGGDDAGSTIGTGDDADTTNLGVLGTWYGYLYNQDGFCTTRFMLALTDSTFEYVLAGRMANDWVDYQGLRGGLALSGSQATLTPTAVYYTVDGKNWGWISQGTPEFAAMIGYLGGADIAASLVRSGDTLTMRYDQDRDGRFDGNLETVTLRGGPDDTQIRGTGTYPMLRYIGLNFYNAGTTGSSYLQIAPMPTAATVQSAAVDMHGPTETRTGIALTWFPDRGEWGISSYPMVGAEAGLWWISRIEVHMSDGGQAVYSVADPWGATTYSLISSTGFVESGVSLPGSEGRAAEGYLPPPSDSYYYLETFPNASSAGRVDPAIKVFASDDLLHWFACNDDGGAGNVLFAALKLPLSSGKRYYIAVYDRYRVGGTYSIRISKTGFGGKSSGLAVVPDAYEPDDSSAAARPLTIDVVQDRSFSFGDVDWLYFDVP
jgi:hypothetical protein